MKTKIISALKTKYSNLGFAQAAFDAVGDYLAKSVTEEAQIETAIGGVESLLKVFQSEADKLRAEKAASAKELEELKAKQVAGGDPDKKTEPANGDDVDAKIAAKLAELVKPLHDKVNAYEAKETASARATLITTKAKELGIPEWRIKEGFNIAAGADEAVIGAHLATVAQNIKTAGLAGDGSKFPIVTGTDGKPSDSAIDEIRSLMRK